MVDYAFEIVVMVIGGLLGLLCILDKPLSKHQSCEPEPTEQEDHEWWG